MPTIPGASEQVLGQFLDIGGMVHNVRHDNYGAVGDGSADDTQALRDAIAASIGGTLAIPTGIYGVTEDIDFPENLIVQAEGATIKWIGGVAPVNAVVTCNLLGAAGQVDNLRIKGLRVDANGQPVAARFLGLGPSCEISMITENYTSRGMVIDQAGAIACDGFRVSLLTRGQSGSRGLELGNTTKAFIELTVELATSQIATMARGLYLTANVAQCVFQKILIEDCDLPVDIGDGGGCVDNTFIGVDGSNPTAAPSDVTIGAFTGTVMFGVRNHATPNNFHSIIGIRDNHGYARMVFDDENTIVVAGGAGVGRPVIFGASGPVSIGSVVELSQITFPDLTSLTSGDVSGQINALASSTKAYRNTSTQTIPDLTTAKVQLNAEEWDPDGIFDPVTNYRCTPLKEGKWLVVGFLKLSGVSNGLPKSIVYKNGVNASELQFWQTSLTAQSIPVLGLFSMNGTTDYLEIFVSASGGPCVIDFGVTKSWVAFIKVSD